MLILALSSELFHRTGLRSDRPWPSPIFEALFLMIDLPLDRATINVELFLSLSCLTRGELSGHRTLTLEDIFDRRLQEQGE